MRLHEHLDLKNCVAVTLNMRYYSMLLRLTKGETSLLQDYADTGSFNNIIIRCSALFEAPCKNAQDYLSFRQRIIVHMTDLVQEELKVIRHEFSAAAALMAMDIAELLQTNQKELPTSWN